MRLASHLLKAEGMLVLMLILLTLSSMRAKSGTYAFEEHGPSRFQQTEMGTESDASSLTKMYLPLTTKRFRHISDLSRGYLTTPFELVSIKEKSDLGMEPYATAVEEVLEWADRDWDYGLENYEDCDGSEDPEWIINKEGIPKLYAKALAFHLTGNPQYAHQVTDILQQIMTKVSRISIEEQQCRLNFGWGTPELVSAADLIEEFWLNQTCSGPTSTSYSDISIGAGNCKMLFQNWLVKNPYYVVSYSAVDSNSNWGAAATNATAYVADYLWDRPEVLLVHRNPKEVNEGKEITWSPSEAFDYANQLALDRMNGYGIEYGGNSCDLLNGEQQSDLWPPVKSQITHNGIIAQDARRDEFCNIPAYNGEYQNYPQLHLGNNIQQCELMLRRGYSACYDNVDHTDLPSYTFTGPDGELKTTHLYPGRGSIERAINAIVVDSGTDWDRDQALAVAYRYYFNRHRLAGIDAWSNQIDKLSGCGQDICFGVLTHGFAPGEIPELPPIVAPP